MRTVALLSCLFLFMVSIRGWCQDSDFNASEDQDEQVRRIVEERRRREAEAARIPTSTDGGATVEPEILKPILDKTLGLRFEERDAYFRILELARQTPLTEQQAIARDFREARRLSNPRHAKRKPELFPSLVDVINNPDIYRGRPVSLHGVLRKLTKFDPGKNNRNIGEVYEGWIYTDDSHAKAAKIDKTKRRNEPGPAKHEEELEDVIVPTVVIFQGKPEGLNVGGDIAEEVRFTGYFFKLYQYESQDRFSVAPLFLAGAVEWRKGPQSYKAQSLGAEVYLLVTLVFVVIAFVWYQGNRREMASAIHPQEANFAQFPPVELPRSFGPQDANSQLKETHDE